MATSSSASKAFQERSDKLPSAAKEQLDKLQQEYKVSGQDVLNAWDVIALTKPEFAAAGYPQDEMAFHSLRRQLEVVAARKKKAQQIPPVSNIKTVFNLATPPPIKKRANEDISPPSTDAKRQLTMDQLNTVQPYVAPDFSVFSSSSASSPSTIQVLPANDWTAKWTEKKANYIYMNASLESITDLLRNDLSEFGEEMLKKKLIKTPMSKVLPVVIDEQKSNDPNAQPNPAGSEDDECAANFDKLGAAVQSRNVVVCGRIVCESENGKLNAKSVILEGVNGIRVKLDLDTYSNRFSLFPGQHVVVEGMATGSTKIRVERIYEGFVHPAPAANDAKDSKIWIASGPYTRADDLQFDFLDALLAQVSAAQPDVLMLLGPFVDANHRVIASGRPFIKISGELVKDVGFEDVLAFFLARISTALKGSRTKVCLLPCTDDVTHSVIAFPQPSLDLPEEFADDPTFISLPNPATINIGNVVVGVANVDALFDFQDEGTAVQGFLQETIWQDWQLMSSCRGRITPLCLRLLNLVLILRNGKAWSSLRSMSYWSPHGCNALLKIFMVSYV